MWPRDSCSRWWLLALFSLALLFAVRTTSAQEQSALDTSKPLPSETPLSLSLTPSWSIFDQLWTELQQELIASAADSELLLTQLQELQIELDVLRSSLAQLETHSEALKVSLEQERMAFAQVIVERDRARVWAKVAGGAAAALGIALAISLAF